MGRYESPTGTMTRPMPAASNPAFRRRGALSTLSSPNRAQREPRLMAAERYSKAAGASSVIDPVITTRRRPKTFTAQAMVAAVILNVSASHGSTPFSATDCESAFQLGLGKDEAAAKLSSKPRVEVSVSRQPTAPQPHLRGLPTMGAWPISP